MSSTEFNNLFKKLKNNNSINIENKIDNEIKNKIDNEINSNNINNKIDYNINNIIENKYLNKIINNNVIKNKINIECFNENEIIKNKINNKYNIDETDKILILVYKYSNFFNKLINSVNKMNKFYNQCKEYYYIFNIPNTTYSKKYDGRYIKKLFQLPYNTIMNSNIDKIDKLYYIYYKNSLFFKNILESFNKAKENYYKVKEYYINIIPPIEIYSNDYISKVYSSKDIFYLFRLAKTINIKVEFKIPYYLL